MQPSTNNNLSGWSIAAIALTAFILITPTFHFGQISGNDFNFHIQSWMEVVHQWHQGVAWPSWSAGSYEGYGEPRFIFYPPISWLIGGALGTVLPWIVVPDVFLVLVLMLAGICMHRLASRWMSSAGALAAALIYMTSPYQLVDVYVRSPYAELLAGAIFPLAVLCTLNCAQGNEANAKETNRTRYRNIALLSIVFAAIWLTNAPIAVVTSYSLAFLLIILACHRRSLAPLFTGTAGMALGLLLACEYIVPATFEQRWVSIEMAISRGLIFADSIIFMWRDDPRHHIFNVMISSIAAFEIIVTFIAAIILWRRFQNTAVRIALFSLAILAALMMLPFTGNALQYLPKMRFVQFPWRWLVVLGLSFSFFFGSALASSKRRFAIGLLYAAILVMTIMVLGTDFGWWDSEDIPQTLAVIQSGQGYGGTEEYGPRVGDPSNLPNIPVNPPRIRLLAEGTHQVSYIPPPSGAPRSAPPELIPRPSVPGNIAIDSWLDQHKVFTINSPKAIVAAIRLLDYPAWRVRVNGNQVVPEVDSDSGQMLLPLASGINHIEIKFGWTSDRTVGCALSGLGVLILSFVAFIGWRRSSFNDSTAQGEAR